MERAIVVRGTLHGATQIVLDEPLDAVEGPVEVVVRSLAGKRALGDVFDFISHLPAGNRTKHCIDLQLREERESWNGR